MQSNKKPAQILVVTLFVLMIVAVIVVGVVSVAGKDALQTTADVQYNQLYDAAERTIITIIDSYGSATTPLSNLTNSSLVPSGYTCQANNTTCPLGQYLCTRSETGVTNQLCIRDSRDISDYELSKDDSFVMPLNNYRGELQIAWVGEAALEFALHYYDTSTATYGVVNDLFDNNNPLIFSSNGGDPFSDPAGVHALAFQTNASGGIRFNLSSTTGINANRRLDYLRITPRMRGDTGVILLDVTASSAGLPYQVRVFDSVSFASNDNHILAQAVSQVPLFPQIINILHYGLLTDSAVTKTP